MGRLEVGWEKVACWSTKAAISLKRVKIVGTLEISEGTHILGASRGRLCDSSAFLFSIFLLIMCVTYVIFSQMILKKYPEIKKLMGFDPMVAVYVSIEVIANVAISCLLRDASWAVIIPMAWIVSATINHSLGGAIHEIGHNLAFGHKRPLANRALGMLANLPMGIPLSVTYKKYHSDHHRYLG